MVPYKGEESNLHLVRLNVPAALQCIGSPSHTYVKHLLIYNVTACMYGTSHSNFNDVCPFITSSFSIRSGFVQAFVQPSFILIDHVIAEAS